MKLTDLIAILPLLFLVAWTLALLLVDLWVPPQRNGSMALLAATGLAAALGLNISNPVVSQTAFSGLVMVDDFSVLMGTIFLATGLGAVGLAYDYLKRMQIERGEFYALILFSVCGMMLMSLAYDLIIVFIALELLSIPLYVLAGFANPHPASQEAAMKYFLLGTFAAAFLLFGIALVFGSTGHTDLPGILVVANTAPLSLALLTVGSVFIITGFAFKIAVVPFHQWAPDVYQGAPTPVTAFMSITAKSAGIAALLRVFMVAFQWEGQILTPLLWRLAAVTMLLGNIVAINQYNIKRMLAYSSIASGGYLLMAFLPYGQGSAQQDTLDSMLLYLFGYALASLAAWGVVIALEHEEEKGLCIKDFAGLGRRHPWLALAMTAAMLSYIGAPLTLGFWGKFYLFRTVFQGGYNGLAILGLLASVVSAYYYLRVVVMMYMRDGYPEVSGGFWLNFVALAAASLVVLLGLFPAPILELVIRAVLRYIDGKQ